MKRPLALTLALAFAGACAPSTPRAAREGGPVQARGHRFEVGGADHRVVGVNFWAAMNLGSRGAGGDRDRLLRELDRLRELGVNNIRIMASSEGPEDQPYRMVPALQVTPGEYRAELWDALDFVLEACAARGIRVVMVLSNFWEWSGGMAQYVTWAEGTPIPYPAENVWTDFTAHAARFYGCEPCQEAYRAHIAAVVGRVNARTGVPYRDDPTIFAWQLANEPRLYPPAWIDDTAAYIRSLDGSHMISVGSEGQIGGPFGPTHDGPDISYATAHLWPQNWEWYAPGTRGSLEAALATSRKYIRVHEQEARALGKPLVFEEFGLARDAGGELDPHDPGSPTTARDQFYGLVYAEVERSIERNGALRGENLWAWGGEARPGEPWVGDPPHEKPGWYSVYDADASTLAILRAHAETLRAP